ncbi:MAG: hypothetical protein J6L23_05970, partial [Clostridia bacterium]|nr:hypothetical protein [Clostridia bacterium]
VRFVKSEAEDRIEYPPVKQAPKIIRNKWQKLVVRIPPRCKNQKIGEKNDRKGNYYLQKPYYIVNCTKLCARNRHRIYVVKISSLFEKRKL